MIKVSTVSDLINLLSKFPGDMPLAVTSRDGVYSLGGVIKGRFYFQGTPFEALKFVRGGVEVDYDPKCTQGLSYELNKSLDVGPVSFDYPHQ